jgi:hypothetical protein
MKVRYAVPALILTLALGSQPVGAQGHRGGGSRGGNGGGSHGAYRGGGSPSGYRGGGSNGGYRGSAVSRHPAARPRSGAGGVYYGSRPGSAPRGSVAQQRHPGAGSGHGYGYGYGYGYGHGGGYGHGYYRGGHGYYGHSSYRPYYGYRAYYPYSSYYPYYPYSYAPYYAGTWPGVSLSFGWGYGSSGSYAGDDYSPSVSVYGAGTAEPYVATRDDGGAPPPPVRDAARSYEGPSGRVRLEVRPDDTSVYVDDEFHGTAREARIMRLPPGRHVIELVRPGFAIEHREVTVVSGASQDVLVELLRP